MTVGRNAAVSKNMKYFKIFLVLGLMFVSREALAAGASYTSFSACVSELCSSCSATASTSADCEACKVEYCSTYIDTAAGDIVDTAAAATGDASAVYSGEAEDADAASADAATTDTSSDASSDTTGGVTLINIENPLGSNASSIDAVIVNVINSVISILGALVFLVFIYGGGLMIFAGGNEEKVSHARKILLWAVAGLVLILLSYSLTAYVIRKLFT